MSYAIAIQRHVGPNNNLDHSHLRANICSWYCMDGVSSILAIVETLTDPVSIMTDCAVATVELSILKESICIW